MIRLKNGSRTGGLAWDHPSVSPFFERFKPTSWGTGRWKGWGLGRSEPGKARKNNLPLEAIVFPRPGKQWKTLGFAKIGIVFPGPGLVKP
jgi:hypothetical protein